MQPYELAQRLRSHYADEGKLVYDRLDRWTDEHAHCRKRHETKTEGCLVVESCGETLAVVVVHENSVAGSRCGRCRVPIDTAALPDFIYNDHLCVDCRLVPDSDWAQRAVTSEREGRPKGPR